MLIQEGITAYTFSDAVEHLLDVHELDTRDGLNKRRARASVLQAYRDLPSRHTWSYYYRQRLLSTVASQSSSTITYDHSGGAAERLVTLASGTWPSWAAFGRIIIDSVHYEVATRESSTTLTLEEDSNPGEDVAAGTSYEIYQSAYVLPVNFQSLCRIWDIDQQTALRIVDPDQYHTSLQAYYDTPSTPWEAMIRSTGEHYGGRHIHFAPPPNEVKAYDLLYRVRPRPLAIDQYSTGTVAVSVDTATVTGTTTVFPTNCAGSVIRFSGNTTPPTSHIGAIDGGDNPYVFQAFIKTRTSDTALVLEEATPVAIAAGSAYVISDPLDIEPGAMLTALLKMAEAEFSVKAQRKDAQAKLAYARQAVLEAMEADQQVDNLKGRRFAYDPFVHTTVTDE